MLGGGDYHFLNAGGALPEPCDETVVGGNLIDAAAAFRTVAKVGRDPGQVCLIQLAQGERPQRFVARVIWRSFSHDKTVSVGLTAKQPPRFTLRNRRTDRKPYTKRDEG